MRRREWHNLRGSADGAIVTTAKREEGTSMGSGTKEEKVVCGPHIGGPNPPQRTDLVDLFWKGRMSPGLIHYLGTDGFRTVFRNPAEGGGGRKRSIKATRSSSFDGKASDICSRDSVTSRTDWKAPLPAWWTIQLRENMTFHPMRYALQHGFKDGNFVMFHWKLEGFDAGQNCWVTLIKHAGDAALETASDNGQGYGWAAWPLSCAHDAYFRAFRVVMACPNASGNNFLCLSGIELYGTLCLERPP